MGQEDPLEESLAIHSSILAWRNPWTEEADGLQSIGLWRVRQDWSNLACTHGEGMELFLKGNNIVVGGNIEFVRKDEKPR